MKNDQGFDADGRLERDLQRTLAPLSGPSPRSFQSAYHAEFLKSPRPRRSWLGSMASSKAMVGLAVAALGVGGGSLAAAAATGSTDPGVWGATVTAAVQQCKLDGGVKGIGDCVSAVAKQKGAEARADHSHRQGPDHPTGAAASTPNGHANGNGNGNANGNGNGNGNGNANGAGNGGGPPSAGPKKTSPTGPPTTPPGHTK